MNFPQKTNKKFVWLEQGNIRTRTQVDEDDPRSPVDFRISFDDEDNEPCCCEDHCDAWEVEKEEQDEKELV
jgi:hypothetical protein